MDKNYGRRLWDAGGLQWPVGNVPSVGYELAEVPLSGKQAAEFDEGEANGLGLTAEAMLKPLPSGQLSVVWR